MDEPTFDGDGYPTDETLDVIRNWPLPSPGAARLLLRFAQRTTHPVYGKWFDPAVVDGKEAHVFATGGWSGNEDVVGALDENRIFTMLCWQRSERGGLHEWRIPLPVMASTDGVHNAPEPAE